MGDWFYTAFESFSYPTSEYSVKPGNAGAEGRLIVKVPEGCDEIVLHSSAPLPHTNQGEIGSLLTRGDGDSEVFEWGKDRT